MIPFRYSAPVDTPKQLARYRDELLRFLSQAFSPQDIETSVITLPARHLKRFMEGCQEADRTHRELEAGFHPLLEAARDETAGMRARLLLALNHPPGPARDQALQALADQLTQPTTSSPTNRKDPL